jgi:hypothetical protein
MPRILLFSTGAFRFLTETVHLLDILFEQSSPIYLKRSCGAAGIRFLTPDLIKIRTHRNAHFLHEERRIPESHCSWRQAGCACLHCAHGTHGSNPGVPHSLATLVRSGHPDSNRESLAPKASMLAVTLCPVISHICFM